MVKRRSNGGGRAKATRPPLPRPGDPLVLPGGEVIQPDSLSDIGLKDPRPLDVKPKDFRSQARRNLEDIAAEPHLINACAAILSYTILGISDREIQLALRITEAQLVKARAHEVYDELFKAFQSELINANSSSLHSRIASYAHGALSQVAVLATSGKKEETRLSASRDILDRAGTKAADQTERQKAKPTGLKITVVDGETSVEVTDINLG